MWRILMLPMNCLYKCILVRRIMHIVNDVTRDKNGPIYKILQTCKKYDLLDFVMDSITSADYVNVKQWEKMGYDIVLRNAKIILMCPL